MKTARKNNGVLFEPDANTVLWLPGQDDAYSSTIRDRSGYGNDGAITGATWKNDTPSGLWALSFDGVGDYVRSTTPSGLSGNTACTLECWVILGATGTRQPFVTWGTSVADAKAWLEVSAADAWQMRVWDSGVCANGTPTPNTSDWVHVAGVYDKTNTFIYTQGVQRNSTAYSTANIGTDDLFLGDYQAGGLPLTGDLALVRVYSRALSATELLGHYNQERHLFGV